MKQPSDSDAIVMKYVGDGTQLPGVPTRDLTRAEVWQFGEKRLLLSGLYRRLGPGKQAEVETMEVT